MKKRNAFKQMSEEEAIKACADNRFNYAFKAFPATLPSHPVTARGKRRAEKRAGKNVK